MGGSRAGIGARVTRSGPHSKPQRRATGSSAPARAKGAQARAEAPLDRESALARRPLVEPSSSRAPASDGSDGRLRGVDLPRIGAAVREILLAVGDDPDREGLRETPERVARMYDELLVGTDGSPDAHLGVTFEQVHDEMIVLRDVPFYSICEHHLMPFFGTCSVAYIPGDRIVGLSKLARVVEHLARRLQLQERLTTEIADAIERVIAPIGVAVKVEAEHLCMTMRGVRKPGSRMVTTVTRGAFRDSLATRQEFLDAVGARAR
ncbi:MAG: GTP cyclohydrolase I FolE [Actinobacteria bacterium]|nr:GTP cyclohydrolase I FolE [Actinomycetota bacterium]